jgi:hypothetical protein
MQTLLKIHTPNEGPAILNKIKIYYYYELATEMIKYGNTPIRDENYISEEDHRNQNSTNYYFTITLSFLNTFTTHSKIRPGGIGESHL